VRRFLRRLISRLYAERDRLRRHRLGAAGDVTRFVVLRLSVDAAPVTAQLRVPGATIGFADPDDLLRDPAAYWMQGDGASALVRGGLRCLVVRTEDTVIYRAVVTSDPARVAAVLHAYPATLPAALVSGVVTHPEQRGRGIHAAAMGWLARVARQEGATHLVAWVALWNRSSLRAFERAGFRPLTPQRTSPLPA
jgi:GNAT superfamily N-acetyltransferase